MGVEFRARVRLQGLHVLLSAPGDKGQETEGLDSARKRSTANHPILSGRRVQHSSRQGFGLAGNYLPAPSHIGPVLLLELSVLLTAAGQSRISRRVPS